MSVNSVDNNNNPPTQGRTVRNSIAAGLLTGGALGYFKPVTKKGEATDSFLKEITHSLKEDNRKQIFKTNEIIEAVYKLPEEGMTMKEIAEAAIAGKDSAEAAAKKVEFAQNSMKEFITRYHKEIGIIPEEGQVLGDAIEKFMGNYSVDDVKNLVHNNLADQFDNRGTLNYQELAKEYFENVFDKTKNKFKAASEEVSADEISFIKKAMKNTKLKTGVIYGTIAAAGAGLAGFILSSFAKNSNPTKN